MGQGKVFGGVELSEMVWCINDLKLVTEERSASRELAERPVEYVIEVLSELAIYEPSTGPRRLVAD
jgi:hypothetical protein